MDLNELIEALKSEPEKHKKLQEAKDQYSKAYLGGQINHNRINESIDNLFLVMVRCFKDEQQDYALNIAKICCEKIDNVRTAHGTYKDEENTLLGKFNQFFNGKN